MKRTHYYVLKAIDGNLKIASREYTVHSETETTVTGLFPPDGKNAWGLQVYRKEDLHASPERAAAAYLDAIRNRITETMSELADLQESERVAAELLGSIRDPQ